MLKMAWIRRSSEPIKSKLHIIGKCDGSDDFDDNRSSCSDESVRLLNLHKLIEVVL